MRIKKVKFFVLVSLLALAVVLTAAQLARSATPAPAADTSGCSSLLGSLPNAATVAPWYCAINNQIAAVWQQDALIAVVAVMIAFIIAAIIFMGGVALRDERVKNYGIGEIYEAIASAIIVGAFLYVCAVLFGYGPSFFVGTINPYPTSMHLIMNLTTQTKTLYNAIYGIYFKYSLASSFKYSEFVPLLARILPSSVTSAINKTLSLNPIAIATGLFFTNPAEIIMPILADGAVVLWSEYYLIIFFAFAAIPVFIVPGVIFRAFIPTRGLGGMMIAMGIGFYLIVPTLFAVVYYFTAPSIAAQMTAQIGQLSSLSSSPATLSAQLGSSTSPLAQEMGSIQSTISTFWLLLLFFPPTIAGITYAFVVQIAEFIGGASHMGSSLRVFGRM